MIKTTSDEQIKESIRIQVLAKFKPKSIIVPKGWMPKTAYDRHLVALVLHDLS